MIGLSQPLLFWATLNASVESNPGCRRRAGGLSQTLGPLACGGLSCPERRGGQNPDQLPGAEASHHAKHRTNDKEGQRSEKCLQKRPQAKPKGLEHIRILT